MRRVGVKLCSPAVVGCWLLVVGCRLRVVSREWFAGIRTERELWWRFWLK